MKALSAKLMDVAPSKVVTRLVLIFAFTIATALAAQVKVVIPGTVVPITLQTAIVLLAGLRLGARDGAISQALYIALGALGMPFFSGALGAAVLTGPTGGYIIGFVFAAALAGKLAGKGLVRNWLAAFVASFVILGMGMIQLKFVTASTWSQAFAMGVAPFLLGDVVKVTFSALADRLTRRGGASSPDSCKTR